MKQVNIILGIILLTALIFACNSNQQTGNQFKNYSQEQLDSLKRIECDTLLSEMRKIKADTFGKVQYIPENFEASLTTLDSMVNPQMKEWIKCLPDGEFSGYVHHGFGMYLRNNWGLWRNSKLAENLFKMGIFHPDDMSGIILDSYQRKLKGEEIKLDEQLKYYQNYWRESGVPVDSILNELEKEDGG